MNNNLFVKNQYVLYIKNNIKIKAIIKDIHYDDIEPYYTIIIKNKEIQTISKYLLPFNNLNYIRK